MSRASCARAAALSELRVQADLIAAGFRVYELVAESQHPDLVVLDDADNKRTVEVRSASPGRGHRRVKRGDRCDHYAWVWPDGRIEYEPPLPRAASGEGRDHGTSPAVQ